MFALIAICFLPSLVFSAPTEGPIVWLDSGTYKGVYVREPAPGVKKFLGIPFAEKPMRFSPPVPAEDSSEFRDATQVRPACIQQFSYPEAQRNFTLHAFNQPPPQESEDCLYINVWSPAKPPPPDGWPVMFWIYGGGLEFGTGGLPTYDGTNMSANTDVVVVTFNYRTNAFGFPGVVPGIPESERNLGFLDQRLALDWTQNNIAEFGGDPDKVTIFGESAGSMSVDFLVLTMADDPPFRGAIMESGTASLGSPAAPPTGNETSFTTLARALGCPDPVNSLDCVRTAPATSIKSIIEKGELSFLSKPDGGLTFPENYEELRKSRNVANVPIMIGTNAQEGRLFAAEPSGGLLVYSLTTFLDTTFPNPDLQTKLRAAYPVGEGKEFTTEFDAVSAILTDFAFDCPTGRTAHLSASVGYPTYRYYFNESFANTQAFAGGGVYHNTEIFLVFGNFPGSPQPPPTDAEIQLSRTMQTAWTNFAKDPYRGPGLGWEKYEKDARHVAQFGYPNPDGMTIITAEDIDYRCALFGPT